MKPTYSALVELFGHRDMAADEPAEFHRQTGEFRSSLVQATDDQKFPVTHCIILLDKCFIWHDSPVELLDFLNVFRMNLLRSGDRSGKRTLLLRGLVLPSGIDVKMFTENDIKETSRALSHEKDERKRSDLTKKAIDVPGLVLDSKAWALFGRVEVFKGVGIWVDDSVLDHCSAREKKEIRDRTFPNYFVPKPTESRFSKFSDLRFLPKDLDDSTTENLARAVRESYHQSTKLARFYVPLLINWIQHMDLKPESKKEQPASYLKGLDYYIILGDLKHFTVMGFELVFAKLIDRLYPESDGIKTCDRRRWDQLNSYLMNINNTRRLLTVLKSEDRGMRIPEDILKRANRRAFTVALAHPQHK